MKKKVLKIASIIISIVLLIVSIVLYFNMKKYFNGAYNYNSLEAAALYFSGTMLFGTFIYNILSILSVWINYFLINLLIKVFKKYDGIKKVILFIFISIIIVLLYIFIIFVMYFSIYIIARIRL